MPDAAGLPRGTVLAFDCGERRIGVAVGEWQLLQAHASVSYTHLDVYKRQDSKAIPFSFNATITAASRFLACGS